MREGWETQSIGKIATIINGGTPKSSVAEYWGGDTLWITPKDMGKIDSDYVSDTSRKITKHGLAKSSAKLIPTNSVILSTRAPIGHLAINTEPMATNQGCRGLVPSSAVDTKFLFYFLRMNVPLLNDLGSGTTFKELARSALAGVEIPLPALPEQKRIVAILDEAFEGLAVAVANTEKNLANARELFEGYLNAVFTQKGEGWVEKKLGEAVSSVSTGPFGSMLHKSDYIEGGVPIVNPINIVEDRIRPSDAKTVSIETAERLKTYVLDVDDIVIGRRGEIGRCAVVEVEQAGWLCGTGCFYIKLSNDLNSYFLSNLLRSAKYREELERTATGATMKNLSNISLQNLEIVFPANVEEQYDIVCRFDELSAETKRLQANYQQKLAALSELKQSILQKAFAGELTSELKSTQLAKAPKSVEVKTTSPEFTANILAFAYHRHVANQRDKTFGHVKAQKMLHLVESIGGVDLGRTPVKDAAGPNDFQHMLKAEDWAEANQFFKFVPRGRRYDFKKLSRYKEMIAGALATIKPYREELDRVLDLVIPMNTNEAELFATVHASWNDLILDGAEINDKAIILAARDNWHPDKMNIPERRFREAIRKIRQKGLIPDGKAKRVGGQESLI